MAWKQRGAHWYYYRSVQHGRQVTKAYLGTGSLAEWQAAEDAAEQEAQRIKADTWRHARTSLSPLLGLALARCLHAGLVTGMAHIVLVFALRRAIVPPVRAKTRR